ncbi:MAG: restriction alleviation protein, Lar family [Lachnospiraceae bacterium]|nr:restriction alleviation protein, Lar family [Lachnospiraceae bacterium]MCI9470792.1 restriction alleviation protein, Lar family [Lachnospiraceae bacterium]
MDERTLEYARRQLQDLRDPALMDTIHDEKEGDGEMEVLKKCPFCGGTAIFKVRRSGSAHHDTCIGFAIGCKECGVEIPKTYEVKVTLTAEGEIQLTVDGREAAIAEWNRRDGR